ncbi:hypothetical protein [Hymenobacter cellulosivorans]|uniref:Uncharacterized protein n=1 Tax=Hymenobacter cellulosivorans TaxID=2932249 RepID=A0ABY4F891_9BACT|nr:hypothetical protein [Hymenobacter cellulosivorans]UOQ52139.1 hypothetical protein MUN80_20550 [Hymenobacter cellulosivorans]
MRLSTVLFCVLFFCSCTDQAKQTTVIPCTGTLYEIALDSTVHTYIEQYITKVAQAEVDAKEAVVAVTWMGIFGGQRVYISQSGIHPKTQQHYPQFWARHRGYLVFVYDSKHSDQLVNPQALQQEIDQVLQQEHIKLETDPGLIYEPLPWRITEREGKVQIDTSQMLPKVPFS